MPDFTLNAKEQSETRHYSFANGARRVYQMRSVLTVKGNSGAPAEPFRTIPEVTRTNP